MLTEDEMESGVVTRRGVEIARGNGSRIWDSAGREYLDMGASYGVCNVGHCNPRVADAISRQIRELIYISSSYDNPARRGLMRRLISASPEGMERVFLCNSGTESVEAAVKFAVKITGKDRIIAAKRGFHGRTMGALSLTWNPSHREGLENWLCPVDFVGYGDPDEIRKSIDEKTAAVILEPIQGEGGVHVPPEGYLSDVREICDESGALLITDEVQTGMCRTGDFFAVQHEGVVPDLMCVGKSLGGGLPIAATLINRVSGVIPRGSHGSTFGGNPAVCAAASAVIDFMIDEELDKRAGDLGNYFIKTLRDLENPLIREIRGRGLMIGVELKTRAGPYLSKLLERGIAAIPTGATVIRFLPPLVIDKEDIDLTISVLSEVLDG
jgi:acetylornithine/LysW-gamma-L-lysine aminotransferase